MRRSTAGLLVLAAVAAACGTSGEAPTTIPVTIPDDGDFSLIVEPANFAPVMPGQQCVVLVTVEGGTAPVAISTLADGATVEPATRTIDPGTAAEFTLVPASGTTTAALDLTATRGDSTKTASLAVDVIEWTDDLEPLATELRERFVAYLESNRSELGITRETSWVPTITKPQILVVMHYLFFSEDWEMGITWHVTVPEHAWSHMYLRPRAELRPTIGLEIPSWPDPTSQPVPWEPPPEVDR